jgi:hypothetical protein
LNSRNPREKKKEREKREKKEREKNPGPRVRKSPTRSYNTENCRTADRTQPSCSEAGDTRHPLLYQICTRVESSRERKRREGERKRKREKERQKRKERERNKRRETRRKTV